MVRVSHTISFAVTALLLKAVKQNCATCKEEDSKLVDHDLDEWSGLWCRISLSFSFSSVVKYE